MGPLLGPLVDQDGKELHGSDRATETKASNTSEGPDSKMDKSLGSRMRESQYETNSTPTPERKQEDNKKELHSTLVQAKEEEEGLRVLVIGDRLFTDTLLANRLAKLLLAPTPSTSNPSADHPTAPTTTIQLPSVISIHTTQLPQPKDVRFLRWIEDKLTKGRIRESPIDYGRFILREPSTDLAATSALAPLGWRERMNPFRDTPPLTWHPRSWRPAPLAVGLGSGLWFVSQMTGRGAWRLLSRAWEGEVEVAKHMAEQAERATAVKEAKTVVEEVETAGSVLADKKVAS